MKCPECERPMQTDADGGGSPVYICENCERAWPIAYLDKA